MTADFEKLILEEIRLLRSEIAGIRTEAQKARKRTPAEEAREYSNLLEHIRNNFRKYGYFEARRGPKGWAFWPVALTRKPITVDGIDETGTPQDVFAVGCEIVDSEMPYRFGDPDKEPAWKAAATRFKEKWDVSILKV